MIKGIDLQMLSFVGISLVQDYLTYIHFPKVYYWNVEPSKTE
ncbi:hypothetical protein [Alkalihalobacterium chitinilyticum]|uniref:Uncharacterized protein n=1 Tax=Alkalihalobacterium chitinilyticum TaxID=2980103 RepID=A0ABT5VBA9_9BACI|nr:hypothetical protein [Alkalihalobacterium chitinilyticum]MDE5412762.1 hypothetical protein [Alkalihalobacterium chitinilyticum]